MHKHVKDKAVSFKLASASTGQNELLKKAPKSSKKKTKTSKRGKAESFVNLLGFDSFGPSAPDAEYGFTMGDYENFYFREKPARRRSQRESSVSIHQHVQGNHRFILKPNRNQDYFFVTYDPDYEIDWDDVFMVHAKRNTEYICPICREEEMVAPQITKCGHIFCWPCILHYMLYHSENEETDCRKCPLCE